MLKNIRNDLNKLTLEELQKYDLETLKENLFKQGVALLRPLLVISDMRALLSEVHYDDPAAIIPVELADIIVLDGLEELLTELIQEKTPKAIHPITKSVEVSTPGEISLQLEKVPKPLIVVKEKKKSTKSIAPSLPPVAPSIPPLAETARDFLRLKKSREILQKLEKEEHFTRVRQNGSHIFLRGPQGHNVTVPNHPEIATGNLRNIARQAGFLES